MSAKYTPGPWLITTSVDVEYWIEGIHYIVGPAIVPPKGHCYTPEELAAVNLISAAPELLEIAQAILAEDMLQYLPAEYIAKVRAAIAKAEGRAA